MLNCKIVCPNCGKAIPHAILRLKSRHVCEKCGRSLLIGNHAVFLCRRTVLHTGSRKLAAGASVFDLADRSVCFVFSAAVCAGQAVWGKADLSYYRSSGKQRTLLKKGTLHEQEAYLFY